MSFQLKPLSQDQLWKANSGIVVCEGETNTGKQFIVEVGQNQSVIPREFGKYFILWTQTRDAELLTEITREERAEMLMMSYLIAHELSFALFGDSFNGRFRITINGPQLGSQDYFHIHIVCVAPGIIITHANDPIVK